MLYFIWFIRKALSDDMEICQSELTDVVELTQQRNGIVWRVLELQEPDGAKQSFFLENFVPPRNILKNMHQNRRQFS